MTGVEESVGEIRAAVEEAVEKTDVDGQTNVTHRYIGGVGFVTVTIDTES